MPLEVYKRRHSVECLKEIERRIQAHEIKRPKDMQQYRSCACRWWLRGTTDEGQTVLPRSIKVTTYEAACEVARQLNQAKPDKKHTPIETATKEWFDEQVKIQGAKEGTRKTYDLMCRKLLAFAEQNKLSCVQEFDPQQFNQLQIEWAETDQLEHSTRRNYRTWISGFFKYCVRAGYLDTNPVDRTLGPKKKKAVEGDQEEDDETATMPLDEGRSDTNYRLVISSLPAFLTGELRSIESQRKRARTGLLTGDTDRFIALCELMYETGLRVSDALHFDPARMVIDETGASYTTKQIKTGDPVTVFLDPWLVTKLQSFTRLGHSRYIFFDGRKTWKAFITNNVRKILRELGEVLGFEQSLRPHRFRDSFAVHRLNKGQAMKDVSLLLGHKNEATTERFYSPFVQSTSDALRERVQDCNRKAAEKERAAGAPDKVVRIRG